MHATVSVALERPELDRTLCLLKKIIAIRFEFCWLTIFRS